MNEPIPMKAGWQVQTTDQLYRGHEAMGSQSAVWFWSAWGPRGYQSGAEGDPSAAAGKAYAASIVLNDPRTAA